MTQRDPKTFTIIGAAMEVHQELGCGFLEAVYQEALALEFDRRQIPYRAQPTLPIFYKGQQLQATYRADFICYEGVVVELKALSKLGGQEHAQVINYLKATGLKIGLLLNFGATSLEYKRFVYSKKEQQTQVRDGKR